MFEDAGLLAPPLIERGYRIRVIEPGVDDPGPGGVLSEADDSDLLIVLGGPIGVGDAAGYPFLVDETAALREWIDAGRPVLGICLGAQLIAAALGARVRPTGRKEIGFSELELTDEGSRSVLAPLAGVDVLHWHGDEFLVPDGAALLASTPGFPNQAFAVGGPTGDRVLALQFHLEVECGLIERWLIGHAGELAASGIDPQAIRDDAATARPALEAAAAAVFSRWLDRVAAA